MAEKVHLINRDRWHPAVWKSRLRIRWPFIIWVLAIAAAVYLYGHGGRFGVMAGVVDAKRELISPLETARILSTHATIGQRVRAGDILVRMDTSILDSEMALEKLQEERRFANVVSDARIELREAKIQYAEYQGEIGVLEAELQRLEGLLERRLVDAQDVMRVRARYEALSKAVDLYPELIADLESDLEEARKRMETMEVWLSSEAVNADMRQPEDLEWDLETGRNRIGLLHLRRESYALRAQNNGMISGIFHEAGEVVPEGEAIMSLIVDETTQIIGYLPEANAHEVDAGMPVYVRRTAEAGAPVKGTVLSMVPEIMGLPGRLNPFPNQSFRGRHVIIEVEQGKGFLPGENVTISLHQPLFTRLRHLLFPEEQEEQ